jgi:hypothetical protein
VDTAAPPTAVRFDQELHDELIGMLKRDQSEQAGGPAGEGAAAAVNACRRSSGGGRTAVPAARGESGSA